MLAILGTSPGMSPDMRRSFAAAGYKGGSEPGVLNYSWLLRRPSGAWYAVTVSWNNPAAAVDNPPAGSAGAAADRAGPMNKVLSYRQAGLIG